MHCQESKPYIESEREELQDTLRAAESSVSFRTHHLEGRVSGFQAGSGAPASGRQSWSANRIS